MIPVLYGPTEKRFTSRGLGPLPDASMAHIEEVRLGEYELEMEYPVTGLHFDELQYGNVIKARNAYLGEQPFDIYYISKPMSGIVTVRARHISYRLNKKVLTPCSSSSAAGAMSAIETHILDGSDFTFWTDKSTQANWAVTEPKNVRAALGGTEGSILDVFGGEYEWDGFTVKLHGNRGSDNGVSIRFGKNLLDLVAELDASDVVTACVPYYTASDGTCVYGSKVKSSAWSSVNDLVTVMDMKEYFTAPEGAAENWTPTTAAMEETALQLMEQRLVYQATQHLKVDFALLSQSKEYAHLAALERVNLCDYVTVAHPGMGIDVKVKVIKTVWDVLADRYDSIELGEPTARLSETLFKDLNDALNGIQSALDDKVSRTHMDIAIENATNLLTGGTGGHVVIGRNADGEPNEIFIMNTADQSTATSVIRINMNGIGFSSTGINGPFRSAWTIDGHFVADFIDTGTLTGSIIKAGILRDEAGINYWNMETGEFQLTPAAKIKTGTDSYVVLSEYIGGIADEYVTELEGDLQAQIDSKIDTFYQSADPSTGWTTEQKAAHTGDLWFKTTDKTTWRWNGSTWQEQEVPTAVFDEIDGKSAIFYGTTAGTYTGVQTGDYLVDSSNGSTYRWSGSAWVKQTDYATAIATSLADLEEDLQEQIDGKIDTFYQSADPSTNWTTEQKTAHTGDLWYKTSDSSTWRWSGSAWQEQSVPDEVFDAIDGKSTIFYGTKSGTYTGVQTGDYLVDSTSGKTYRWDGSSWVVQTDYATAISNYDTSLNQQAVFNKLTNNSQNEGVYLSNGHLYVNGSMIRAGEIDADLIKAGILKSQDSSQNFSVNMLTGEAVLKNATFTGASRLSYHPYIGNGKISLTNDVEDVDSILMEDGRIKLYGLDSDFLGYIRPRDTLTDTSRFGLQIGDGDGSSIVLDTSNLYQYNGSSYKKILVDGDIDLTPYATVQQLNDHINNMNDTVLPQYATKTWVNSQGFLKSADFSQYATIDWVDDNYVTFTEFNGYLPKYVGIQQYTGGTTTPKWTGVVPTKLDYGGSFTSTGGLDMTDAPISYNHPYWGNHGMETSEIQFIVPQTINSSGAITKWANVSVSTVNGFVQSMGVDPDHTGSINWILNARNSSYPVPS